MDAFDFVIIGAGPGRRGRRLQGARARRLGGHRRSALVRRELPAHRLPALEVAARRRRAPRTRTPRRYDWNDASAQRDYMVNRPATAEEPDDGGHVRALEAAGAIAYRGSGDDRRTVAGSRVGARRRHATRLQARNVMVAVGSTSKRRADRRARRHPDLDEPRGDAGPRAAEEPARPGWRADRLRARPGLRPVRRAHDDRPVRPAAGADRPSAQLRGHPDGARTRRRRRSGPGSGPLARPSRRRRRRRARDRARRRIDRRGPRHPARGRPRLPDRRPRARALRHRHERPDRRSRATAACGSPTGCG